MGWDSPYAPASFVTEFTKNFGQYFEPSCALNAEAIFCHAAVRECQQVDTEWFPSSLCRSECEKKNAVWKVCVEELESSNPDAKMGFDESFTKLVCTYVVCYDLCSVLL
jgi:hypothetical protein